MTDLEVYVSGEPLPPTRPAIPSQAAVDCATRWLGSFPFGSYTRAAYERDLVGGTVKRGHRWTLRSDKPAPPAPFFEWCRAVEVDPLAVTPMHVIGWVRWLDDFDLAASTVSRKISALRGFYRFTKDTLRVIDASPVPDTNGPLHIAPVPTVSTTRGLSENEVGRMLVAARARSLRDAAIVSTLYYQGVRVSELIALDVGSIGYEAPHRTLHVFGKGRKPRLQVLSPHAARDIDAWMADRTRQGSLDDPALPARAGHATGGRIPLFDGPADGRMTRRQVDHIVASAAIEGYVPGADPADPERPGKRVTPHVLRHAITTHLRSDGADIGDVGDHLGHAHPSTTARYDRAKGRLDRSPIYRAKRVDLDVEPR